MPRADPRNKTRYWFAPRTPGLSLLQADFTDHAYGPHSHEAMVIAVTELGGSEFRSRGLVEEADHDSLLVFNPDEPHSGQMGTSRRWRYRSFYLDAQAMSAAARAAGLETAPYFTRNAIRDRELIVAFNHLHRIWEKDGDPLQAEEGLAACFGQLYQRHADGAGRLPPSPKDRRLLKPMVELIQDRFRERLTLDDLSEVSGLTHFQLIGLFKRTMGLSPYAFITQVRLQEAIQRLKGGMALAETALTCGLYDQSALNHHFKRAYGITPLQYARAAGGGDTGAISANNFA